MRCAFLLDATAGDLELQRPPEHLLQRLAVAVGRPELQFGVAGGP
jgi:hypothetical protein